MASQFFATKGMRPKYNYVDAINAQTPYLPQQFQEKQTQANKEREFAQGEKELRMNEKFMADTLKLQKKQQKQGESDSSLADMLGIGQLGVSAYMAYDASKKGGTSAITGKPVDAAKSVIKGTGGAMQSGGKQGLVSTAKDWIKPNQAVGDIAKAPIGETMGNLKDAVSLGSTLVPGAIGYGAGKLIGKKSNKKKKLKSSLGGAAAGAATNYLTSGGDLYKTAIGALSGGGGGFLSNFKIFG